jgi:predicted N-formylglutamate amidohydrolase
VLDSPERYPALIVCDHASNRIPERLHGLGLDAQWRDNHIAVDIGAKALATALASALGISCVLGGYSRLVVDCNRRLNDPSAFPEISDGIPIPGNCNLTTTERQRRVDEIYWPYHHAVRDVISGLEQRHEKAPAVIAIHSFTPVLEGITRTWHAGILWDADPRMPSALIRGLREEAQLEIGDNEPYSGRHPADFTIDHHAEAEGLAHVGIEVRQDLIGDPSGVAEWTERLRSSLQPILQNPELYRYWPGPRPVR